VYSPGYPYPPPPPRRAGLSTLAIVLIVMSVGLVLGGGACIVLGGLVLLGASAESEAEAHDAAATSPPALGATDEPDTTGATTAEPTPAGATAAEPMPATATGAAPTAAPAARAPTSYSCNATGYARVCGFANVCSNQLVFGNGYSFDRHLALMQAKNACESSARARGSSTFCTVSCLPR
jgi:hypothetical protein